MKILIMGLPGSGKTTLANQLNLTLHNCVWYNADITRKKYDDWDFSKEGRIRQAHRMKSLSDESLLNYHIKYVICDFVAPTKEIRNIFDANYTIWMDTINKGRFKDTNKIFEVPKHYDLRFTNFNYDIEKIAHDIQLLSTKGS